MWKWEQTSSMSANYSGTWDIVDNENFEAYMVALGKYIAANIEILPYVFLLAPYNGTLWYLLFCLLFLKKFHPKLYNTGIDFATRKIAGMLKPQKIIEQDGDSFTIKTLTTFRNYTCSFKIGEEFEEVTKGLDNRKCQVEPHTRTYISNTAWHWKWCQVRVQNSSSCARIEKYQCVFFRQTTVNWDNDKLVCVQKGEKKNRSWMHWIDGDHLYLVSQK